jgi:hypothetical protein
MVAPPWETPNEFDPHYIEVERRMIKIHGGPWGNAG